MSDSGQLMESYAGNLWCTDRPVAPLAFVDGRVCTVKGEVLGCGIL
jgi:hypothetical protein